jgi:hypothetical protein
MKRILLTLTCLLAFAVSAFATEERVSPPQDQGAWYLTVFGEAEDAKFVELQNWLATDMGLTKLRTQVRFNKYTTDQVRYQRYVKNMPGLPCIRLQNEMGLVVSEFWGDNIPSASSDLYRGIKGDLQDKTSWGCLRRRRCPKPEPKPEPPAPPVVVPEPPVGPPVLNEEPEPEESKAWLLLVVLAALGGGAYGFVEGYKAERMDVASPSSSKL